MANVSNIYMLRIDEAIKNQKKYLYTEDKLTYRNTSSLINSSFRSLQVEMITKFLHILCRKIGFYALKWRIIEAAKIDLNVIKETIKKY